jgi:fructokinase
VAQAGRLAGVELGGTKAIAVLAENGHVIRQVTVPTTGPHETLERLSGVLREWNREVPLQGLGIASFGPVQLHADRPNFATILQTPKPGWNGADIAEPLTWDLTCPWTIDTDVNAAALAEYRYGSAIGCDSVCYITVGTGIGGGLVIGGRAVHGALHPEMGHLRLRRTADDSFAGSCRFHGDCIEGLVSGPALAERFGMPAPSIADDHPTWRHVASDMGELVAAVLLMTAAEKVVFGGSVPLARAFLLGGIRNHAVAGLGGYLPHIDSCTIDEAVVISPLGTLAGPLGAVALAELAANSAVEGGPRI